MTLRVESIETPPSCFAPVSDDNRELIVRWSASSRRREIGTAISDAPSVSFEMPAAIAFCAEATALSG